MTETGHAYRSFPTTNAKPQEYIKSGSDMSYKTIAAAFPFGIILTKDVLYFDYFEIKIRRPEISPHFITLHNILFIKYIHTSS